MKAKFQLGQTLITANALRLLEPLVVSLALNRHASGDWGDIGTEDAKQNESALLDGTRLFSAYQDSKGTHFWIITDANPASTTVLLPEDY